MKPILTIVFYFFLSVIVNAQSTEVDKVKLKNGQIIYGYILDFEPGKFVLIKELDGGEQKRYEEPQVKSIINNGASKYKENQVFVLSDTLRLDTVILINDKELVGAVVRVNDKITILIDGIEISCKKSDVKKYTTNNEHIEIDFVGLDKVYLVDGSVIEGKILKIGAKLKIATGGIIRVFNESEVEKYIVIGDKRNRKISQSELTIEGVNVKLNITGFPGQNVNGINEGGRGFHVSVGEQISHFVGYGAGIGYDVYSRRPLRSSQLANLRFIPVYLSYKAFPFDKRRSFYFGFSGGYGFPDNLDDGNFFPDYDLKGGVYMSAFVGHRFSFSKKTSLNLEIGTKHQSIYLEEVRRDFSDVMSFSVSDLFLNRLHISLGFMFWSDRKEKKM